MMGQSWGHKVRIWNREVVETNACKEEKLTGEPIEEAIRKWSVVNGPKQLLRFQPIGKYFR